MLTIKGQVPQRKQGANYFQEVDLKKVFDDICDYQAIIRTPAEAPMVIQRAIQIAVSRRTVCRVELAADVAEMAAESDQCLHLPSSAVL